MIVVKIMGGFGNQLFQYAAGRSLALKHQTLLKLDLSFFDDPKFKVYRLDRFNLHASEAQKSEYEYLVNKSTKLILPRLLSKVGIKLSPYYKKSDFEEEAILKLINSPKHFNGNDYYIQGWFQNEIYFQDYREVITKEFNADHLLNGNNLLHKERIENSNSVAVHIRRGDYLSNDYFRTLPVTYYKKAFEIISGHVENPVYYFFSDDTPWVKNEFSDIKNSVFIDNNSVTESVYSTFGDVEDLMLMRTCKHQIIANSSYSWWGAWLNTNNDKIVIAPRQWYNNVQAQKKIQRNGFLPKSWILL